MFRVLSLGYQELRYDSHQKPVYKKNIKKYPDLLSTGYEATKVVGIGQKIADRLEKKRLEYIKNGGTWAVVAKQVDVPIKQVSKKSINREYTPKYKSGGYAILLALYRFGNETTYSKDEIIIQAQKYCSSSFTQTNQKFYTAWNSITKLIQEELVFENKQSNRKMYCLSEKGRILASKMAELFKDDFQIPPSISDKENNNTLEIDLEPSNCLAAGSFEIVIVLDNREVRTQKDRSFFQLELEKLGLVVFVGNLAVGDFTWIARSKDRTINHQLVLDYVVERKANNDLECSIKDGRYKEQKKRLRNCGCSKVVYLIENNSAHLSNIGEDAIYSGMAQCIVMQDFNLKETENADDTAQYLYRVTKLLEKKYLSRDIFKVEFEDVNAVEGKFMTLNTLNFCNSKTQRMTTSDIWSRQLLTIRGISAQKAKTILGKFPTLRSLMDKRQDLENELQIGQGNGQVTKLMAQRISTIFSKEY